VIEEQNFGIPPRSVVFHPPREAYSWGFSRSMPLASLFPGALWSLDTCHNIFPRLFLY